MTTEQKKFIEDVVSVSKVYAPQYGIKIISPAVAQAILESNWGKKVLASKYHNYHGMKCGSSWKGKSVNMGTQEEYTVGTLTDIRDNFRVYNSFEEGIKGYFEFISKPRYANLKGVTDPRQYLVNIKADGYATDSDYVNKNMKLINLYDLTVYDKEVNKMSDRENPVRWLEQYIGIKVGSAEHKAILKVFNDSKLSTRHVMTVDDPWCATATSAAFIATGLANIFPCVECSCEYMINLAKAAGIWVENDAYVPDTGDVILYDWDDNGIGDCTGWSDHVGLVDSVTERTIKVVEGNKSNTVGYREIAINGKYIRGFITPKYSGKTNSNAAPSPIKKSVTQVAKEVIAGKWGNGDERKKKLADAGYNFATVQAEVNKLTKSSTTPKKTITQVAQEVLAGKWGNGDERKKKLADAGYNFATVQAEVNKLLRK